MAKKIHKLKNVVPEVFKIICIASHQNDYRLSWALNEKLNINLKRVEDHQLQLPQNRGTQNFSLYASDPDESLVVYHLISNKSEQGYLLKNMKNIDYFLKISGEMENISLPDLVGKLKRIPIIITAFELENPTQAQMKKFSF